MGPNNEVLVNKPGYTLTAQHLTREEGHVIKGVTLLPYITWLPCMGIAWTGHVVTLYLAMDRSHDYLI